MNSNCATKDAKSVVCDGTCGFPIHSYCPNQNSVKLIKIWNMNKVNVGKSCSFDLPRVSFVNCCQFMYLVISFFGLEGRMWDLIV